MLAGSTFGGSRANSDIFDPASTERLLRWGTRRVSVKCKNQRVKCKRQMEDRRLKLASNAPKLSTLCYAHAAPRQPEQLPDYTLMYAHIGRLAILHISTVRLFVH